MAERTVQGFDRREGYARDIGASGVGLSKRWIGLNRIVSRWLLWSSRAEERDRLRGMEVPEKRPRRGPSLDWEAKADQRRLREAYLPAKARKRLRQPRR